MKAAPTNDGQRDGLGRPSSWLLVALCLLFTGRAAADEGGVSFWLPGQFSSFAAVPSTPGFSLPFVYYRYSGKAGADTEFLRGARLTAGVHADADVALLVPTYVLAPPVLGGQMSLAVAAVFGRLEADVDGTLTGPGGRELSGVQRDALTGFGDLYPSVQLRWGGTLVNGLAYVMGGIPIGAYGPERLANLGTNHWSVDMGAGLTLLNQKGGQEFSAVLGGTYNFENPTTHYQNGVSVHGDAALSQFLSKQVHLGAVGYLYNQFSADEGPALLPSGFKSRVYAAGPQVGMFCNVGSYQPYLNLKGYYEFGAKNRTEGFSIWLTVAIPFSPNKA